MSRKHCQDISRARRELSMEKDVEKKGVEKAEHKKEAQKEPEKKRELYKVKMEVLAPVELTFKVWAYTPQEAAQIANMSHLAGTPKPLLNRMRKVKASVYKWFFTNILHTRTY